MSTMIFEEQAVVRMTPFQKKCDQFSKQCAVLLTFVIPLSTAATNVVLLCLIPAWFLAGNLAVKANIASTHPVARKALLLFSVFAAGAVYSHAPTDDIMAALGKMTKLLYIPFLLALMTEEKWRRRAIAAFLGGMLLTFVLCVLKKYGGLPISTKLPSETVFKDHIYTNLMMALASFIAGHYCLRDQPVGMLCLLLSFLCCLIFYVLFISTGRSGYVVFSALWILLCAQRFSFKGFLLGVLILAFLIGLSYKQSKPFNDTFSATLHNIEQYEQGHTNTSVGSRLEYMRETVKLAKEHPWFGFGTGAFKGIYRDYATTHHLLISDNPHNEYLNIFFQLGLLGLSAFLALLGSIFTNSYRLQGDEKWFAQGIVVAMIVGCVANAWLMDFTSGYLFVALTAIFFGGFRLKKGYST